MEEDNRPSDTIPDAVDVAATEGDEKVSDAPQEGKEDTGEAEVANPNLITLEELSRITGRKFESKEDASKAIKDTYAFVGKKKEDVKADPEKGASAEEVAELKTELYFTQNPDLKDARPILEAIAKANGQTIQEAAETDVFKENLLKTKGYEESQEKRVVMEGNRRFDGGVTDQNKELSEAVGDRTKSAEYVLKHILK